jgi:DNA replication protein DnaC
MERLGDALARLRPRLQARFGDSPVEPEPEPVCPLCRDFGFVRRDVPIDHPDFGRAITCVCRQGEVRDRLRRRSNLGHLSQRTFATFRPEGRDRALIGLEEAFGTCREYATAPLGWLVLTGPSGSGKTHLAAAIANRQIELGNEVFFAVVPDLLDHLRATFGPGSDVTYDELFEAVRNASLLVLDDLGTQSETSWAQEKMFQVLNHRFNAELPTVITTNHAIQDLDDRLRARLSDRAAAQVRVIGERDSSLDELLGSDWSEGLRRQTFETFKPGTNVSLANAVEAAAHFAEQPLGWLILVGDVGRGKTHLAAAIKNHLDETAVFITVPRLLDHLRATYAPTSQVTYDRAFDQFLNAAVLILDDYGTHSAKPWAEEKLFQLINHRFNARLPTVITTNIPFHQPRNLAPASQQEVRVFSRILDPDLATIVQINADHYRRPGLDLKRRRA